MKKRFISVLICLALLCALLPSVLTVDTNAVSPYNPTIALQFASEHWNDGIGLCAEFVSRCLRAGGCDSYSPSCTKLVGMLRERTDCTEGTLQINPDRTISMIDNLDKIAPGDPFFFHCSVQQNYQHALLCNGMDSQGRLKAYAHNMPSDGTHAITYGLFCPECGMPSIDYATVFHFDTKPPKLASWISDSKLGSTADQLFAGNQYYLCYKVFDEQTGTLFDQFKMTDYKVSIEVYNPEGTVLCSNSYQNDNNWVSIRCPSAGTYTYKVTIAGAVNDTVTGSFEVKSSTIQLLSKSKNETLSLTGNTSKTIELSTQGFYLNPVSVKLVENTNNAFSATLDSFENQSVKVLLQAKKVGSGTVSILLSDSVTSELLDAETISVSVTGEEATISYHANGMTEVPETQKAYCGQEVFLAAEKPTGEAYTVLFDANEGEISETEKCCRQTFTSWNTSADGSGESFLPGENICLETSLDLYAQYTPSVLACDNVPTREGFRFIGWYDSAELDDYGAPAGRCFTNGTELDGDVTLYAMWSASETMLFGDLNYDGAITDADLLMLNDSISEGKMLASGAAFLADVNADGSVDADDAQFVEELLNGDIIQEDLPVYQADKQIFVGENARTAYAYGETLNEDDLSLYISYGEGNSYQITDGLTVAGFDSGKIGEQTLQVSFGQLAAEWTVSVTAPEYLLNLNANGGSVEERQIRVTYGSAIGELPLPLRPGYTFVGWSLDSMQADYVSNDTVYESLGNQTVYAFWKEGCAENSHNYEMSIVAPTCTQSGCTVYSCKVCGRSHFDQKTDPIAHSFAEGFCSLCGAADPSYVHGVCDGKTHCPGAAFVDYPKATDWSHLGIDFCIEKGLFNGESETRFSPNNTMTRAMLVTVLYRMEGTPEVEPDIPFADVREGIWYMDAVIWAAENGIVNGMDGNLFCPDNEITREQIATIFYRYASFKGYDTSANGSLKPYPDEKLVGEWAYDALTWATGAGLINGNGRAGISYLDPQASATRAQTATILMRFMQNLCR